MLANGNFQIIEEFVVMLLNLLSEPVCTERLVPSVLGHIVIVVYVVHRTRETLQVQAAKQCQQ